MSLAALAALALVLAHAPVDSMAHAVEAFGFDDVRVSGFAWLGCGEGDVFRRKWSAQRRGGERVQGVVCGGLTKGWTVRITGPGS
ncbi:MAG: hypothetical protein JWP15_3197 [Alphaproteobacteria bacterium]|nr:hypothetical protein [Alphaproteobacteria bacterium]